MPRRARAYLSGMPYHIVQRGNNREACFIILIIIDFIYLFGRLSQNDMGLRCMPIV
ncbi:MAG: REP element-mobilizing transposase RayT [Gammaproteobacteria bacterium]|jgi:REP element-mobilizing transposase RayT